MFRTSVWIALMTTAALVVFIVAAADHVSARCVDQYNRCMNSCATRPDGHDGSPRAACIGKCGLKFVGCVGPGVTSGGSEALGTFPTTPPPKHVGEPPVNVGVNQPGGGTPPPKGVVGLPPINVGTNQPPDGGGSSPPKGPIGLNPPNPVGVELPGSGSGSGETIYAKGGIVKPPVVTTSPIGLTTTTLHDEKGNSISTDHRPCRKDSK